MWCKYPYRYSTLVPYYYRRLFHKGFYTIFISEFNIVLNFSGRRLRGRAANRPFSRNTEKFCSSDE
jgi:hypothetical protein